MRVQEWDSNDSFTNRSKYLKKLLSTVKCPFGGQEGARRGPGGGQGGRRGLREVQKSVTYYFNGPITGFHRPKKIVSFEFTK